MKFLASTVPLQAAGRISISASQVVPRSSPFSRKARPSFRRHQCKPSVRSEELQLRRRGPRPRGIRGSPPLKTAESVNPFLPSDSPRAKGPLLPPTHPGFSRHLQKTRRRKPGSGGLPCSGKRRAFPRDSHWMKSPHADGIESIARSPELKEQSGVPLLSK